VRPWAWSNSIQTRGPLERHDCTNMAMPISEAAIGITHTSGKRRRRTISGSGGNFGVAVGSSATLHLPLPGEPRVETHGRQHSENHHRAEKNDSRPRLRDT